MVTLKVHPSKLKGHLSIPPSKSHTMRALILGSLGAGETTIRNYLNSPDTEAMIKGLRLLGVPIDAYKESIKIAGMNGQLKPCENVIDAKNSGQVLRFIGSVCALLPTYTILTGDHSIRYNRPVQELLSALNQLNGFATSSRLDDRPPIIIRGPIQPGHAILSGEDSQPVSGLLIATSFLNGTTHLTVKNPGEKPWIDLTLDWLTRLGANITHQNYEYYTITGPLKYKGFDVHVPGDWSSAAFPMAAALITRSSLTLENIDTNDVQGDKKLFDVLKRMGAKFEINPLKKTLSICPNASLTGIKVDANDIIDAIPILAVLGCFAKGKTEITNVAIARKKESDRLYSISLELRKMGAQIEEKEDSLTITFSSLIGASLNSHKDHRIAMALAVASLAATTPSSIEGVECIAKSYPTFADDFHKVGACMEVSH